jgi:hypothetical protein
MYFSRLLEMIWKAVIHVPSLERKWPFLSIHRENERDSCCKEKSHNSLYVIRYGATR